jgi:hypothetical protein
MLTLTVSPVSGVAVASVVVVVGVLVVVDPVELPPDPVVVVPSPVAVVVVVVVVVVRMVVGSVTVGSVTVGTVVVMQPTTGGRGSERLCRGSESGSWADLVDSLVDRGQQRDERFGTIPPERVSSGLAANRAEEWSYPCLSPFSEDSQVGLLFSPS